MIKFTMKYEGQTYRVTASFYKGEVAEVWVNDLEEYQAQNEELFSAAYGAANKLLTGEVVIEA